jgi:hypothetical protein
MFWLNEAITVNCVIKVQRKELTLSALPKSPFIPSLSHYPPKQMSHLSWHEWHDSTNLFCLLILYKWNHKIQTVSYLTLFMYWLVLWKYFLVIHVGEKTIRLFFYLRIKKSNIFLFLYKIQIKQIFQQFSKFEQN